MYNVFFKLENLIPQKTKMHVFWRRYPKVECMVGNHPNWYKISIKREHMPVNEITSLLFPDTELTVYFSITNEFSLEVLQYWAIFKSRGIYCVLNPYIIVISCHAPFHDRRLDDQISFFENFRWTWTYKCRDVQ